MENISVQNGKIKELQERFIDEKIKEAELKLSELFSILDIYDKVDKQHVVDSPKRIAKMLVKEVFKSLYEQPPEITVFDSDSNVPVILKNLIVRSMCAHHWMPFYGYAHIVYIPDKKIAGLSKFQRIVDYFSRKPQVQEKLTKEIVDLLKHKLDPLAIGVKVECVHLCMKHRGVENESSTTETIEIYTKDSSLSSQILSLLENLQTKKILD